MVRKPLLVLETLEIYRQIERRVLYPWKVWFNVVSSSGRIYFPDAIRRVSKENPIREHYAAMIMGWSANDEGQINELPGVLAMLNQPYQNSLFPIIIYSHRGIAGTPQFEDLPWCRVRNDIDGINRALLEFGLS